MEHQRADVRFDLERFDSEQRDLVVTGRDALIDRALEPDRCALDEHRTGSAGFPTNVGEAIAGFGRELMAGDVMIDA
jgi:hypothetical protein